MSSGSRLGERRARAPREWQGTRGSARGSGLPQFPTLITWQEAKKKMFPKCHRLSEYHLCWPRLFHQALQRRVPSVTLESSASRVVSCPWPPLLSSLFGPQKDHGPESRTAMNPVTFSQTKVHGGRTGLLIQEGLHMEPQWDSVGF